LARCDLARASIRNARFTNNSVFDYNCLEGASMDGTTFEGSHVHPWQRDEFRRAKTQPSDYGDMTEQWRALGEPFAIEKE
jgi:uncharacterized protein YjbI with pentapeptide repeats